MKSYNLQIFFLLISLFSVPLSAKIERPLLIRDPQVEQVGKQLFNEFKDLDQVTFQKKFEAVSPTDPQTVALLDMFLDHGEGSRDLSDKILFLAGIVHNKNYIRRWPDIEDYILLCAFDKGDQSMITKLLALGYKVPGVLDAAIQLDEVRLITPILKVASINYALVAVIIRHIQFNAKKMNKMSKKLRKELPSVLKRLPSIDIRDNDGRTLLFIVKNKDMAKMLLKAGININAQDKNGQTALYHLISELQLYKEENYELPAETKQLEDLIGYLLQQGADPYIKDKSGKSAFDLAKKGRLSKILGLMKRSSKGKK